RGADSRLLIVSGCLAVPGRGRSTTPPFAAHRGERMSRVRAVALVGLVALGAAVAPAAADPAGFAFLEIPAGARASGMGGAFSSLAQGVDAAYPNPAGPEAVRGVELAATPH